MSFLSAAFGIFKSSKVLQYILLATILIAAASSATLFAYNAGKESAKAEYKDREVTLLYEAKVKVEKAISDNNKVLRNALILQRQELEAQNKLRLEEIKNEVALEKTVTPLIKEIYVTEFVCRDLGSEFIRLFNKPIQGSNDLISGRAYGEQGGSAEGK